MSPDQLQIPKRCPKDGCESRDWLVGKPAQVVNNFDASTSAYLNFAEAIGYLRKNKDNASFRVIMEFDECQSEDEVQP